MSEWQPIETAPKDGTTVILWCGRGTVTDEFASVGYWFVQDDGWQGWCEPYNREDLTPPTHWMPLPVPPKEPS